MLVFVDESGDTGFKFAQNSSRYFVVSLVLLENQERADQLSQRIDLLRQELRAPNLEFHFVKNKDSIRRAFLSAVQSHDFTAAVLVVDKAKLSHAEHKDRDTFYKSACGLAFETVKEKLQQANVLFDESGGRKFKQDLAASLKRKINSQAATRIRQVRTTASKASNLIQLADYACGVVARAFEEGDVKYQEIIKRRLSVTQWPE